MPPVPASSGSLPSAAPAQPGRGGRPVTPETLRRQVVLEEIDLAPDGGTAVVVRRTTRPLAYRRELWLVPLDGTRPRAITDGSRSVSRPRWSPDGRRIAFLAGSPEAEERPASERGRGRRRREGDTQVWDLPAAGGRARQLTHAEHDVAGFEWSPDGTRLAIWGWAGPARFLVGERADGAPLARRITDAYWRWDWTGHVDRRTHLSVIAARPGREGHAVTAGDFDVRSVAWDADGHSLVFTAAIHDGADLYPRPAVWRVGADGSDARGDARPPRVAALRGAIDLVSASPDGRWLALVGVDTDGAPDDVPPGLFLVRADGQGSPVELTRDLDLHVGSWLDTDLNGWTSSARVGPEWELDAGGRASALVVTVTERGRSHPWRFAFDADTGIATAPPERCAHGESTTWGLAVAGGRMAAVGTLGERPMEVMTVEGGEWRTRTTLGSRWLRPYAAPRVENRWFDGPEGPIETWLCSPADAGDASLPLVVDIHGGPVGGWAPAPSLEVRMLTSAGYRVALPNVAGSAGYGGRWITRHLGRWGDADAGDVVAVVDALEADGLVDAGRVGLLGLSFGGFLVHWLLGAHPERFRAAVSEAGVANQINTWANSDCGPDYDRRYRLGEPFDEEGVAALWRQSPLRLASRITAPLLMLQGESDVRCPPADNEQLFVLLRALGRTVEYVLYPESWHAFGVAGRPDRRIDRHERIVDWFRRHL